MSDWLLIAATIWCACAGLVWLLACKWPTGKRYPSRLTPPSRSSSPTPILRAANEKVPPGQFGTGEAKVEGRRATFLHKRSLPQVEKGG